MHSLAMLLRRSSTLEDDLVASPPVEQTSGRDSCSRSASGRSKQRATQRQQSKSPRTTTDGDDAETFVGHPQQQQQEHVTAATVGGVTATISCHGGGDGVSNSASRQTIARRARRDKHASRREKKATKTLAIVLGK